MKIAITIVSMLFTFMSYGQTIDIEQESLTLSELFEVVQSQTNMRFVYSEDDVKANVESKIAAGTYSLDDILKTLNKQLGLEFKKIDESIVVTSPKKGANEDNRKMFYQTVRGVVLDLGTGSSLPAANIFVIEYPESSVVTDLDGKFELQVPLGRVNVAVSYIGYQTTLMPMLINSGQEQFLEVNLEASVENLGEVLIEAERDKARTKNDLAYASGRGFTVLEANRYAGTLGDPARMARSFAGVLPARDDRNDIIIRGNSPTGIQWRLDGIEIPNPNHYGGIGLTGNTTTLLNMNLLGNSDFLMGAFPSEYGNALAGVFDLSLKKVNPEKRQYRFQTGWNGFEFGTEGPFSKKKNIGTYSLTYRYSFLDVVDLVGVDLGVLPKFQDLTGYFDFNISEKTELTLIGIWGISFIELDDHDLDSNNTYGPGQYLKTGSDIWLAGANVKHRVNEKVLIKTGVSAIGNRVKTTIDTFNFETDKSRRVFADNSGETKLSGFLQADHRTIRNLVRTGARWDTYIIDYNSYSVNGVGGYDTLHNQQGELNLARLFVEDEYRFTDHFRARAGVHGQYFLYNGSFAVEPRIALRYLLTDYHALSFAYGNHHQLQPRTLYFVETQTTSGTIKTNKNLDFSGAHHLTLAYDYTLTENMRMKAEAYYQHLYDIPVENNPNSTFSVVNVGADFYIPQNDSLVNEGIGRNYGVELTLERFLNKGYYFMANGSAFKSEYQAMDRAWRSTAFDMGFTINALGGYEKWFGQKVAIGFDAKLSYAGGKPYVPVDEAASIASGEVVYNEAKAYNPRYDQYFRSDVKIYYRINYKRVYTEFAVDLQNITNHKNVFQRQFNPATGNYDTSYQMSFFPMATFRCLF